ncbi:pyrroline-5-carboxylate reductase [Streptococcus sp. X16XC17]|uniref:pyrroline-5-carboxylate reductase n=1 Tax=unclassified Streptococcus TaxID=2608887 RepID=UPI00066FFCED|nr:MULTISPECIES: pyrroline-5-carboxylate reductase [unclassified Streptococcus]TCD46686.1 pyrroline-5-carboxylate reductase [Streptococcus sp. X16XC17]
MVEKKVKVGIIGLGNMGGAVAQALSKIENVELLLSHHNLQKAQALQDQIGGTLADNETIAAQTQVLFLGVKPRLIGKVLAELEVSLAENTDLICISMAAGVTLTDLVALHPSEKWLRMMPNTPVAIGQGMTTFATENDQVAQLFEKLMAKSGQVKRLPESLIDAATAIAGCGPAFVYEMIEAMSRAGVQNGLTVANAQVLAAQTLVGSAQMVLESPLHPAQLRDQVTSPGGSTIAGLVALQEEGFQASIISGVNRALKRTKESERR